MKGIVAGLNSTDATLEDVIIVNSLYELESWCTSIVVMTNQGKILHARNMDFDFADAVRKEVYTAQFYNGETELYEATMFGGIIGIYTGIKKGAFSITLNQREFNQREIGLVENLSMILAGYYQVSWLARETLE